MTLVPLLEIVRKTLFKGSYCNRVLWRERETGLNSEYNKEKSGSVGEEQRQDQWKTAHQEWGGFLLN